MQIGGGITAENAQEYLQAGASHVIVTSYVFQDGKFHQDNLEVIAGSRKRKVSIGFELSEKKQ